MKISRVWLQSLFEDTLPEAQALADALTFHAFEIESIDGDVLDVKVTPNRGHDCLSHRGIAKEIAAILKIPLSRDPFMTQEIAGSFSMKSPVEVTIANPELCPRYVAWSITGVKVGPSPAWLKERLESIGQRSINNIVDATNFVMFNIGQPLHAFDADKLKAQGGGRAIAVRTARAGEKMMSLDQKEYAFADSMLLIVDAAADAPIGIAGVKGGEASGVSEATTHIILESANFNGVSIRKTSQALKLRTDASERFQQVLSPELAAYGVRAAAALIRELAGGELAGFADVYPKPQEVRSITVDAARINAILGTSFDEATITDVFTRLGFSFEKKDGQIVVTVPFERLDLEIPEDLAEEVARIVGYDAIPPTPLPPLGTPPAVNAMFYAAEKERESLMEQGYSEVQTSVFSEKGERAVLNKVDGERPFLRTTISNALTDAVKKNLQNKELLGLQTVKVFEIGSVWSDGKEVVKVASANEEGKTIAHSERLIKPTEANQYDDLPASTTDRYLPLSRFPYIVRDIAMWIPESENAFSEAISVFAEHNGGLLRHVDLFDQFKKDGRVSYAFHLVLQSYDKTLTDEEANAIMGEIYKAVQKKGWEVR